MIVAGPNGAGKTTFARQMVPLLHPAADFINADEIQRAGGFEHAAAAAREMLPQVRTAEDARRSFVVETTLASRVFVPYLVRWRAAGYRTHLHFIELPAADFAVARVAARVALGGHAIPEEDVRRRFERGRRLPQDVYRPLVDKAHWYSDSRGLRRAHAP